MEICEQVAQYKIENNLPVFQSERENEIIKKITANSPENLKGGSAALFTGIMDISKCIQQQKLHNNCKFIDGELFQPEKAIRIGCQGMSGSNSEAAARMVFDKQEICFYKEFEDVFKAVESGEIEYGILPVHNSTAGSVTTTYDLMKKYNFYIDKMIRLEISNCLVAKKGTKLSDVKDVYSHPQALAQCSSFIKENSLNAIPYSNTATAAKFVAESDQPIAAICSKSCADMYDFDVLSENVNNIIPNYTRFICISKDFKITNDAKTISILITLPNVQGSLYRLLTKFFVNSLDLEKIESRPLVDGSFNVVFHIDFEGNINDIKVSALLGEIKSEYENFKFLGNYSEIF
jgi:chorismate mutase/prephenate dehydratase